MYDVCFRIFMKMKKKYYIESTSGYKVSGIPKLVNWQALQIKQEETCLEYLCFVLLLPLQIKLNTDLLSVKKYNT